MNKELRVKKCASKNLEYSSKEQGITLIALVITILVLLILAGVSLSMLSGENGIIVQAQEAKENTRGASAKEEIELWISNVKIDELTGSRTAESTEELLDRLVENGTLTQEEADKLKDGEKITIGKIEISIEGTINDDSGNNNEYVGLIVTSETEGITSYTDKDGNAKALTDQVENGDILIYGGYEYRYNVHYCHYFGGEMMEKYWEENTAQNGWGVKCISDTYGELCQMILGNPVTNLDGTFAPTNNLEISPKIPSTITSMWSTYYGCNKLKEIPQIPSKVTKLEGTFDGCNALSGEIVIPDNITEIDKGAFENCKNITKIVFPDNLTRIGSYAFYNCIQLTDIIIPEKVITIDSDAFGKCIALTNISIPASVTELAYTAFSDCGGLISIQVDERNTVYDSRNNCNAIIETSTNKLFQGSNNTVIPNDITEIWPSAFRGCTGLENIVIPEGIQKIDSKVFYNCTGLTSVTIPVSVTKIGSYAFGNCSSLTTVNYRGTEEQWNQIEITKINIYNEYLMLATKNYNYTGE